MSQTEIYEKLTDVFRDVFDDEDLTPTAEMTADDVEEWDSLSHIRLMLSVEKAFGVRFSTVELGGLKSVGDLAGLVESKLNGAG
ncbi:acyl carrier protein [Brevundimonas lenta]|uniref:Acyl carrier protein n=1 Tax=Brevundimonas lenta TaxID=424796 RepID=A0A7W6JFF1_9CAUL|nr:acyl carrier protein [Brevundimonas lenta]MBB4084129.1 acyl carrier protein [Brevundimonas lenta]